MVAGSVAGSVAVEGETVGSVVGWLFPEAGAVACGAGTEGCVASVGAVPETVSSKIMQETDIEVLKRWQKLAAKSGSMEQFMENM